jgi:hypothetical protein
MRRSIGEGKQRSKHKVAVVEKGRREGEGEWKKDEVEFIWEAARKFTGLRQNQIHRDDYNRI